MSESAVSAKTRLVLVWRESGAVRNARPSRGQAAVRPEEGEVDERRVASAGNLLGNLKSSVDWSLSVLRRSNLMAIVRPDNARPGIG